MAFYFFEGLGIFLNHIFFFVGFASLGMSVGYWGFSNELAKCVGLCAHFSIKVTYKFVTISKCQILIFILIIF